jgi:hypothetical protein
MTVYVTQENPRLDMVSATKWGELIPLSSSYDQIHLDPQRMVVQIRNRLRDFSDDDFLLALGDPAIIGIAFAVASDQNRGRINLLKWDRRESMYYQVEIRLRGGIADLNPDEEKR